MHFRSTVLHKGLDPENGVVPKVRTDPNGAVESVPCQRAARVNLNGAMTAWGGERTYDGWPHLSLHG